MAKRSKRQFRAPSLASQPAPVVGLGGQANLRGQAGLILEALEKEYPQKAHDPLPSLRSLARHFGVAANTVQRALLVLKQRGIVYGLQGKGHFWGRGPAAAPSFPRVSFGSADRVGESLKQDLRAGAIDPFARLPAQKILAHRYRISTRTVQKALAQLADEGLLEKDGRTYRFKRAARHPKGSFVVLVTRCDASGRLLLDSEREMDFLKAAYSETRALRMDLLVVGYGPGGQCLDRQGRRIPLFPSGRPVLGFLVSTWLVTDVLGILSRLRPHRLPISIWWEHSRQAFSKARFPRQAALFNLGFGEKPGIQVAEALLAAGHTQVIFLSPFHASAWSQQRLEGLRIRLSKAPGTRITAVTSEDFASPWSFQEQAWKQLRATHRGIGMEDPRVMLRKTRNLERKVRDMLDEASSRADATAWVCVNDEVAAIAASLLKKQRGSRAPYLISFDNSAASYCLGIDSYAFDTGAMVREMLFHLTRPESRVFQEPGLVDLEGRIERKNP